MSLVDHSLRQPEAYASPSVLDLLTLCLMDYVNAQQYILAFKAGRALRRDGTNFVDPKPEKGAVILYDGEDDLLHLVWKDRTTGNVGEVCIICGILILPVAGLIHDVSL